MQGIVGQDREKREAGASLGNIPKFAYEKSAQNATQTVEIPAFIASDSRDKKCFLSGILNKVLFATGYHEVFKSLVHCEGSAIPAKAMRKDGLAVSTGSPGNVEVHKYEGEDGGDKLGYAWLKRCGSAMLCFNCAPKIRYKRAQEVRQACEWMVENGRSWAMITFTIPHYFDQDPVENMDRLAEAYRRFKSGTPWQNFVAWSGREHEIKTLEVTLTHPEFGIGSGAHFHFHCLWFFDHKPFTEAEGWKMRSFIFRRWEQCCQAVGVDIRKKSEFRKYGIDLKLPTAKGKVLTDPEAIKTMAAYISDRAACEISPGIFNKQGKLPRHVSMFEFMALALTKYPQARPYMIKIMVALKGRSYMSWSRGLKALVGIADKTDQEILKEEIGDSLYQVNPKDWQKVNKNKFQRRIIRAVEGDLEQYSSYITDPPDDSVYAEFIDSAIGAVRAGYDPLTLDPVKI